jgi:subtilisin family serine protease
MTKPKRLVSLVSIIFVIVLGFLFSGLVFAIIDQNVNSVKTPLEEPTVIDKDDREGLHPPEENLVPGKPQYIKGKLIIKLKDNISLSKVRGDSQVNTVKPAFKYLSHLPYESMSSAVNRGLDRVHVMEFDTAVPVKSMLKKYQGDPDVEYVQPNYIYEPDVVPNDPMYSEQYAHQLTEAEPAWDLSTGSSDVVVAVIGTGVDIDHPDLVTNIWINPGETPDNFIDDDNNGYIDDVKGWNFYNNSNDPRPSGSSHETKVAGVIAAVGNNGVGICGVTWNSRIMPLRVAYNSEQVAEAIEYARANGAHIINMSFGNYDKTKYGDSLVKEMLDNAYEEGLLLVATAGNDKVSYNRYPAALYNVMAVAATNQYDERAVWSNTKGTNFGPWVDIAAPGSSILSTIPDGGYNYGNGTSFAAPYVSGLGALLFSYNSILTNIKVRAILENTTDPVVIEPDYLYIGTGRVNVWNALYNSGSLYPLGEIVSPKNHELISKDTGQIPLTFFTHGSAYQLEYRAYGSDQWTLIAQGDTQPIPIPKDIPFMQSSLSDLGVPGNEPPLRDARINLFFDNPGLGTFMLRLTVTNSGYTHADTKMIGIGEDYQENWPVDMAGYDRLIMSTAICMDIDEDGENEIIQSSYGDGGQGGYTYIWNADGTDLEGWPKSLGGDPSCSTSAIGDVDGDGDYEIVTTTYNYGYVYVWHWQNGELLSGDWPKAYGTRIRANPILADLDGDGDGEIIVAVSDLNHINDGIHVLQHDGAPVWTYTIDNIQGPMAVADLDGDNDLEIVAVSLQNTYVLDHEGNLITQWTDGSHKSAVIADLDKDGELEIICAKGTTAIRALHLTGDQIWIANSGTSMGTYGAISVGDLNDDGYLEVFVTECNYNANNKVYAWDYAGNPLTSWGFPKNTFGKMYQNAPTIGDINGDGEKELLVGSQSRLLWGWDSNGDTLETFPRVVGDYGIYTTATLADLDQDGDIEIMFGGEPPLSLFDSGGRFYVWDLPGPYNPNNIDWGMYRHDPQCSGLAKKAPKLNPITISSTIRVGQTLEFQLSADNPDNMPLYFYVRQMPEGASFNSQTRTFTWTPTLDQIDETYKFYLFLTDGIRQDHRPVSITVLRPMAEITGLYVRNCGSYIQVYWSYDFEDVDHYKLQWSTDSEFNTLTGEIPYIGPSHNWVNVMDYMLEGIGKTYYFRIAVCNDQGEHWSEVESVDYLDVVPEITNLLNLGSYIKVYWSYACEAHHFKLQWSTDSEFNTLTGEIPFIGGSHTWVNVMDYMLDGTGKTYYFRIAACDENQCGFWSETENIFY